jgi:hypothetical protein
MPLFEQENQKPVPRPVAVLSRKVRDSAAKSFLLLFYKKEGLPSNAHQD